MISLTTNGSGSCGSVPTCTTMPPRRVAATQLFSASKLPDTSYGTSNCGSRERLGVADRAQRRIGADCARLLERTIEHVGDRDARSARQPRRHHRQAADRAGAGDQHGLAEEVAAAVHRVQADRERLGERELAERDVGRDGIALPLAHHEVLAEHALHVREEAGAAEELHVDAQLLAALRGNSRSARTRATGSPRPCRPPSRA